MSNLITKNELDFFECAKDQSGKILNYDGTTDVVQFFKDFDAFCQLHKLGGVISRTNFAEPAYPNGAYLRVSTATATDRDYDTISKYTSELVKFLEKCGQVLRLLKWAISSTLQTTLEEALPVEWETADRTNLERLRAEMIRRYDGWTSAKGELNYEMAKKLGNIVNVESSDRVFAAILKLIREREGWGDPTQIFKEADLKQWLIKRS